MKRIANFKDLKVPIMFWLDDIEDEALEQAKNVARLPFVFSHIALMPDAHKGYGVPIGCVFASGNVIVPNAVGVDIGCGVAAVKTDLKCIDVQFLRDITEKIKKEIPLGFTHHRVKQHWKGFQNAPDIEIIQKELDASRYQIGTLGGGNHFIEIQKGNDGFIWIMIHSGSRNFGLKIAETYHRKALENINKRKINIPDKNLSFLDIDSKEGDEYCRAMSFALSFAKGNRNLLAENVKYIIKSFYPAVSFTETIDIHHNYANIEKHLGKEVVVHRKGATLADKKTVGIIPGSQGSKSYIVKGLGNEESFKSCSHGAGRLMGRNEARRRLDFDEEVKKLEAEGIIHSVKSQKDLDEASGAYKDIEKVMDNQSDLVEILIQLRPLSVIKG